MESIDDKRQVYEFIGRLAQMLFPMHAVMSFTTLNRMLEENGYRPYGSNFALGQGLSAACRYWDEKEHKDERLPATHHIIANVFVDCHGSYAWAK